MSKSPLDASLAVVSRPPPVRFATVLAVWFAVVVGGFAILVRYATTPGASGPSAARWPADALLVMDPERANLVLLAHPRCPCTQATMDELERLLARCPGQVTVHVLFYRPRNGSADWEKTDLWRRARAIPGAGVRADVDGVEAAKFGAFTSGQVMLYGSDGLLLFSGGITNERGHAGESVGTDAILSLLKDGKAGQTRTPVYGCPLTTPSGGPHVGD